MSDFLDNRKIERVRKFVRFYQKSLPVTDIKKFKIYSSREKFLMEKISKYRVGIIFLHLVTCFLYGYVFKNPGILISILQGLIVGWWLR